MTLAHSHCRRCPAPHAPVLHFVVVALIAFMALGSMSCSPRRPSDTDDAASSLAAAKPSEDAISKLNVGVRLLEQLLPADAARRFDEALALQPGWVPALVDLAIARMNILDPAMDEAAATAALEALRLAPSDARAKYVLAYVRAERQRRFGDAVGLLRDVVAAQPTDAAAWYQLGRAVHEVADGGPSTGSAVVTSLDASRAEAEAAYRKALELDPAFAEANYKLGRLLLDSPDAAKQAEGEQVLARHEEILKGRPAVQQNYYRRGALALAYPFTPDRSGIPGPSAVSLRAEDALSVPAVTSVRGAPGRSPPLFRDGLSVADVNGDGLLDMVAPMREVNQPALLVWSQMTSGAFNAARGFG